MARITAAGRTVTPFLKEFGRQLFRNGQRMMGNHEPPISFLYKKMLVTMISSFNDSPLFVCRLAVSVPTTQAILPSVCT